MTFRFLKQCLLIASIGFLTFSCDKKSSEASVEKEVMTTLEDFKVFSKEELKDKIRGGWAGQTIGVTFGGPTEFRFKGTMIQDYQKIVWHDHYIKETFELDPGLYDDVYLDLTFVNILEKVGLYGMQTKPHDIIS